jgi:hypothetical protein
MDSHRKPKTTTRIVAITVVSGFITIALFVLSLGLSHIVSPPPAIINNSTTPTEKGNLQPTTINKPVPDIYSNFVGGSANQSHAHAVIMVFINGKALNFSNPKYQNSDLLMDFENGNGYILHKHASFAWLGAFFESLNMSLARNCLTLNNRSSYCSNFDNQIMFLVNGKTNNQFEHYSPNDGDRILISYGNRNDIASQLAYLNSIRMFT